MNDIKTESPIERAFIDGLFPLLAENVKIGSQYDVATCCGVFRLDFFLEVPGLRMGIECDGEEFHRGSRDGWRDAMILGAGWVDVMFRFRGRDIHWHLHDCFAVLAHFAPAAFSERGRHIVERLASEEANNQLANPMFPESEYVNVFYRPANGGPGLLFEALRLRADAPESAFWRKRWMFAQQTEPAGRTLEQLMKKWDEAHPWPGDAP